MNLLQGGTAKQQLHSGCLIFCGSYSLFIARMFVTHENVLLIVQCILAMQWVVRCLQ